MVWLVPRHSWRRFLCATPRHSWLGFAAGGGGRSPPLLAGVCRRRWCVVCGVWRWCVGGVVAGVWCGWSLATPGGGSCVLLPATPGWVSLPVVVGGPRHSWLGSACGGGVWCVVCGVWRWCVGGVVAGVWCCWSLATPGGGPRMDHSRGHGQHTPAPPQPTPTPQRRRLERGSPPHPPHPIPPPP